MITYLQTGVIVIGNQLNKQLLYIVFVDAVNSANLRSSCLKYSKGCLVNRLSLKSHNSLIVSCPLLCDNAICIKGIKIAKGRWLPDINVYTCQCLALAIGQSNCITWCKLILSTMDLHSLASRHQDVETNTS